MMTRSAGFKSGSPDQPVSWRLRPARRKNTPDLEAGPGWWRHWSCGQATPGSKADFETNVGDRVYFIVDTVTLTPEAQDTLSKQAARGCRSIPM
jgi:outer membrane protein OmpA-like peptidoglycan-associated protein